MVEIRRILDNNIIQDMIQIEHLHAFARSFWMLISGGIVVAGPQPSTCADGWLEQAAVAQFDK